MEWLDILQRIGAGDDQHTEFKRGVGDLSAIGKALCAFANGDGGLIVVGIDDSGRIVGVNEDSDILQERLTNFLHTDCSKPVTSECVVSRRRLADACTGSTYVVTSADTTPSATKDGFGSGEDEPASHRRRPSCRSC